MPPLKDVFLSYSTPDRPLIEEIARRLAREKISLFFDDWHMVAGSDNVEVLENALATCRTCAVFIGSGGMGRWQEIERRAAQHRRVDEGGDVFRVIPVLLPNAPKSAERELLPFLKLYTWVRFGDTLDDEGFRRLVCGIHGIEPGPRVDFNPGEEINPYQGLLRFEIGDAARFFGRDEPTAKLIERLRRRNDDAPRFLAVVGSSGSGKSSLIRAGVLAGLDKLDEWSIAICGNPGDEPFVRLALAMKDAASDSDRGLVYDRLSERRDGLDSLHRATELILGNSSRDARLAVFVDQFEEIFTHRVPEKDRSDFISNLVRAASVPGGRTYVLLAMRADFYHRCAVYGDLAKMLPDRHVLLGAMSDDELREAIEKPARLAGLLPEPVMLERLVEDARGRDGCLPLLQFAMREVCKRRSGPHLTLEAYNAVGGLDGSLGRWADKVYGEFTDARKAICRRIFLRLVKPGQGAEDTRRRALLSELLPADPEAAAETQYVLARLSDPEYRLITTSKDPAAGGAATVEVTHETLLTRWTELVKWLEAERRDLPILHRLTEDAKAWEALPLDQRPKALLSGLRLENAKGWRDRHPGDLSPVEEVFLAASLRAREDDEAEEAAKNQRIIEAERAKADSARELLDQKQRSFKWLQAGLAALIVLSGVALYQAWRATNHRSKAEDENWRNKILKEQAILVSKIANLNAKRAKEEERLAKEQLRIGRSRQLAALSVAERDKRFDRSLLLAVEAMRIENTAEARNALHDALLHRPGLARFLHVGKDEITAIALGPDGKLVAVATREGEVGVVRLWDRTTGRPTEECARKPRAMFTCVSFDPKGNLVASGYRLIPYAFGNNGGFIDPDRGGVILWDASHHRPRPESELRVDGRVDCLAFDGSGRTLAAGFHAGLNTSYRSGVVLWDFSTIWARRTGTPLKIDATNAVVFSPDETIIAASSARGVYLHDAKTGETLMSSDLPLNEYNIPGLSFSKDGKLLTSGFRGGGRGGVVLWNVAERKRSKIGELLYKDEGLLHATFAPDGDRVVAAYGTTDAGGLIRWNLKSPLRVESEDRRIDEGPVSSLAISRDGSTVAIAYGGELGGVAIHADAGLDRIVGRPFGLGYTFATDLRFVTEREIAIMSRSTWRGDRITYLDVSDRLPRSNLDFTLESDGVRALGGGSDGRLIAEASERGIEILRAASPAPTRVRVWKDEAQSRPPLSLSFSPDGGTLARSYPTEVVLSGVLTDEKTAEVRLPVWEGVPGRPTFNFGGSVLLASYGRSDDRDERVGPPLLKPLEGVVVWRAAGLAGLFTERSVLPFERSHSMDASPDGRWGVVTAFYHVPTVWDLGRFGETPTPRKLGVQASTYTSFSAAGDLLATGEAAPDQRSWTGVGLWEVATWRRFLDNPVRFGHPAKDAPRFLTTRRIAFNAGGDRMAVAYEHLAGEGAVVVVDLDPRSWTTTARTVANRDFTREEWEKYFPGEPFRPTPFD